ncbi:MAG TPA: hypothetical protein VF817_02175 [Patescibacteria group bacterium]
MEAIVVSNKRSRMIKLVGLIFTFAAVTIFAFQAGRQTKQGVSGSVSVSDLEKAAENKKFKLPSEQEIREMLPFAAQAAMEESFPKTRMEDAVVLGMSPCSSEKQPAVGEKRNGEKYVGTKIHFIATVKSPELRGLVITAKMRITAIVHENGYGGFTVDNTEVNVVDKQFN